MAKRRKHGDGSVHLRKDGRWEGRMVVGYDEKGLPKTENVLAKTKTECVAKLRALRERLTPPAPEVPKADLSLGNWLDHWYQDYKKANLRPNTQMSYERRIYQHIIPALGGIQLDKLTAGDIQQFYTGLKQSGRLLRRELYGEGLSDQTVRGIDVYKRQVKPYLGQKKLTQITAADLRTLYQTLQERGRLYPRPGQSTEMCIRDRAQSI